MAAKQSTDFVCICIVWPFYYVYRDTIAAPGPVSLLSYVEKLITAGTREGMSYGDTKSHATKVNLRTGTLSKNKNTVSTGWVHAPIITTKMTVVQTLQTADLVLLIYLKTSYKRAVVPPSLYLQNSTFVRRSEVTLDKQNPEP